MSFGGFSGNECGNQNPNSRLVEHVSQDQSQRDARNVLQPQGNTDSQIVREYFDETTQHNFQTFRADDLFRQAQQVESRFDVSLLAPSANVVPPNVSPDREWFLNQLPPQLPPQSFSHPPVPYYSLSPNQFYGDDNILHSMYATRPIIPPPVFAEPSRPHPQSVMSIPPGLRLVQTTVEDLQNPFDWSDMGKKYQIVEASRFFRNNEEGTSTDNVGALTEDGQRGSKTGSDMDQRIDFESLQISEGAEQDKGEMGVSAERSNNSKYVELLKRSQSQLDEEESFEVNRVDEAEVEEQKNSRPLVEEAAGLPEPQVEEGNYENLGLEFVRKFAGFLTSFQNMSQYQFNESNPMLEENDPFQEGLRRLKVGDVPAAVLCFEAAVQMHSDNAMAWQFLGTTQAANEQDVHAIAALKECLKLQPDNRIALMAIAISYTNEGFGNLAVAMLWNWLHHHPRYSDIAGSSPPEDLKNMTAFLNPDSHKLVQDMFIRAANRNPTTNLDPDVQCALGVLFNLVGDCSKASDCFKAALSVRPGDAMMWNRLGATLANGQRSSEAVEAYYRSLSLNPGYVRARYNLGVSCINLGAHNEAMVHLLKALNQQANTTASRGLVGEMSESIWTTTKVVLTYLGRQDLLPAADNRDLKSLNKAFDIK